MLVLCGVTPSIKFAGTHLYTWSRAMKGYRTFTFPLQVMKVGVLLVRSFHPSAWQLSFQLRSSCPLPAWNTSLIAPGRQISSLTRSANHSTVMLAGTFCFLCTATQQQIKQMQRYDALGNRSVICSEERI